MMGEAREQAIIDLRQSRKRRTGRSSTALLPSVTTRLSRKFRQRRSAAKQHPRNAVARFRWSSFLVSAQLLTYYRYREAHQQRRFSPLLTAVEEAARETMEQNMASRNSGVP
jgi:hypothetical protein